MLYPIYALALAISFVFMFEGLRAADTLMRKAAYIMTFGLAPVLMQSWVPSCAGRWNSPGWSLSAEALYYVLFPFTLAWLLGRRTRFLVSFTAVLWAVACSVAALYLFVKADGFAHLDIHSSSLALTFVKFHPLVRLPEFVLGMVLCRIYQKTKDRFSYGFGLALLAGALIITILTFSDKLPMLLLHNGLLDPLWCLLIYGLATARGAGRKIMEFPALVLLGDASYSLYILHSPVFDWLRRAGTAAGIYSSTSFRWTVMEITVMLIVSIISFKFFETPIRRKITARFQPVPTAPAPALCSAEV